jgi:hypothetical protein
MNGTAKAVDQVIPEGQGDETKARIGSECMRPATACLFSFGYVRTTSSVGHSCNNER